jgi:hypothetical protein
VKLHPRNFGLISCLLTGLVLSAAVVPLQAQTFNPYQHNYQGWDGNRIHRSPFRAFLNKFSLSVGGGYGLSYYRHDLPGDLLTSEDSKLILGSYSVTGNEVNFTAAANWLNAPQLATGSVTLVDSWELIPADSAMQIYRGKGHSAPLSLSLTYDFARFRIGGGVAWEKHWIGDLYSDQDPYPYRADFQSTSFLRYYLTMSARLYSFLGWHYNTELQIGKVSYGDAFDRSSIRNGAFFNLGFPIEYEFSEYMLFFVRPSFELKNYTALLPQTEGGGLPPSVFHRQNALYVQIGFRLKYPEVPRCPIASCSTQMKHVHGNAEFRGQPFRKKQNPKIGELHPRLLKYKGGNRKKISGGY